MPAKVTRNSRGYSVKTPSGTKAKSTSKAKAEAQARLLNALDHGMQTDKNRARSKRRGQ